MMQFNQLHKQNEPLLLANVWDSASAKLAEKLKFKAIGTSSAAIAAILGFEDGEKMSFTDLLFMVKRIACATKLPLSVDIEAGYSRDPYQILHHLNKLLEFGTQGINLEDSIVNNKRSLQNARDFAQTIMLISNALKKEKKELFINIRTDTFLLDIDHPLEETIERGNLYKAAGANGLFVPGIGSEDQIAKLIEQCSLPLNVMCMPTLPDFQTLSGLGVKRISMGNFIFNEYQKHEEAVLRNILMQRSFKSLF
ncbi:isocitrate lyase/phosphoenolpyruvate mutase family protein [Flavobacteriaceae bacterium M23B6Z8]